MENLSKKEDFYLNYARRAILEKGKLPPQALSLEVSVLGAMLIDRRAVEEVINIFHSNDAIFYKTSNQLIYKAILSLYEENNPIDILTVAQELKKSGDLEKAGGEAYLVELSQQITSSAHIEIHARILQEKYFKRELILNSIVVLEKGYSEEEDAFELMEYAEKKIFDLSNNNIRKETEKAVDLVKASIEKIRALSKIEGGMSGLPSGFRELDKVTAGWQPSDLIVVAARPGMGKTAFVISMAKNMAIKHDIPVAIFSLEMSSVQIMTRMISSETGISAHKLREGSLQSYEWEILYEKVKALEQAPIYVDDTAAISIMEFRSKARKLVQKGVKMIVIDYLQLMTAGKETGAGNREQVISAISRNLKAIAKDLNIPIIALAQLSRAAEYGNMGGIKGATDAPLHRRPQLSHLRESGAIEQDADIVSFIYRPEYYKITTWDDGITSCEGQAEFIIAKHRNGELKNIKMSFNGSLAKFSDLENSYSFDGGSTIESLATKSSVNKGFKIEDNYEKTMLKNMPSVESSFPDDPDQVIQSSSFDNDSDPDVPF